MSYLLTGISYGGKTQPKPKSIHVVHYLEYDLENKRISVSGDIIIVNQQSCGGLFWLMHRGNIDFSSAPMEDLLSADNFQTYFLKNCYWRHLTQNNFSLDNELNATLPIREGNIKVPFKHQDFLDTFERIDNKRLPFSLYQMRLPVNSACLLRVEGEIKDETYKIMNEFPVNLGVYGGDILIELLGKERVEKPEQKGSTVGYASHHLPLFDLSLFDLFVDEFYFQPDRYDVVLWAKKGATSIEAERLSRELSFGFKNFQYRDRKITSWWFGYPHFYHATGFPNGTRVEVKPKQQKDSLTKRVKQLISSAKW